MNRVLIAFALVALAAPARAGREQQGAEIVHTRCRNCHVVGRGKELRKQPHGMVDLTMMTKSRTDEQLRAWLTNPTKVKQDTPCFTLGLDARQIDILIAFLHGRAQTPHEVVVPNARYQPRQLPVESPPPPPGLVRGR
jgi:cytochrome c2